MKVTKEGKEIRKKTKGKNGNGGSRLLQVHRQFITTTSKLDFRREPGEEE